MQLISSTIKNLGIEMNYSKDLEDEVFHYGGIAGSDLGSNTIENCFAKGNVQYSCRSGCAGAFVGSSDTTNFINCYNEADIAVNTRQGSYVGGIGGEGGYATNCFNTGNISAYASGEGTWNEYSIEVYTGGIIGYASGTCLINSCYNMGEIKQAANQGAIAGGNINGGEQFKYCYYKENGISATATGASYSGAKALSEGNMSNITLFEGFDFASVWKLAESDAYPRLRY